MPKITKKTVSKTDKKVVKKTPVVKADKPIQTPVSQPVFKTAKYVNKNIQISQENYVYWLMKLENSPRSRLLTVLNLSTPNQPELWLKRLKISLLTPKIILT